MLPFDRKPWAKHLAAAVIFFSVVGVGAGVLYLRNQGPLDTGEIAAAVLLLLAIVPPNIAILRRSPDQFDSKKPSVPLPQ